MRAHRTKYAIHDSKQSVFKVFEEVGPHQAKPVYERAMSATSALLRTCRANGGATGEALNDRQMVSSVNLTMKYH